MAVKLVIVDDAPFIREVIRHVVAGTEFEVVGEAKDGVEAVEVILKSRPDVVLMDIVMPRKSGIDATKEVISAIPEIKVIAVTTLDQETMVVKALEAGCSNYVTKPFKKEDLLTAIRSALKP